ncbi:MAG: sulfite exporter TauE/SafE family protein [Cytophagales bacterium]|nr:sulfite exporter TauE/SafE family protein [Cytophagales bacterium]
MLLKIAVLGISTILAFWISAICGGGASLILVPLLNLLLPSSVVPFSLTIGTFSSSVSRIVVFRKSIHWKVFFWFVPFSIPAVLVGAWLMKYVDPMYLQFFVALFLIANVAELFRSRRKQEREEKPYPPYVLAIVGFLAGFISGVTGAIGLLFNRFYLRYGLTKEEIVATRAANEVCLHTVKLVIYILLGLFSTPALWLGMAIAGGAIISSYTVKYILPYLSEFAFRKIGYGAMVASGVALLVSTTQHIVSQDKISIDAGRHETTIKWRESNLDLEYSWDDGLEVERPIQQDELPEKLKVTYNELLVKYDQILLEKVFRLGKEPGYEFYCYKDGKLTKYDFDG